MTKQEARRKAKSAVAAMSDAEREWSSGAITDALTSLDVVRNCKRPFVFLSAGDEPDTYELVGLLLALEKTVSVPRMKDDGMEAVVITPYTDFRKNRWGIEEPARGHVTRDIDVAIVPMVAFDGLKRVGHGKGCYDRFFAENPDCVKIGIAFSAQKTEGLETESHDVALDAVVTEKEVITAENAAVNAFFGEMQ